jgi:hypothetical protein
MESADQRRNSEQWRTDYMRIGSGYGAYEDAGGAQGERLEDVGAAADAAVEEHGELPAGRLDDLLQRADGRRDVVQLARAVVGHDDPRRAVLHRQPRCNTNPQRKLSKLRSVSV